MNTSLASTRSSLGVDGYTKECAGPWVVMQSQKKHVFFNKKTVFFFLKTQSEKKRFLMLFFKHLLFNARKIHLKYFGVRIYIIYCKFCNIQHKFTGHSL